MNFIKSFVLALMAVLLFFYMPDLASWVSRGGVTIFSLVKKHTLSSHSHIRAPASTHTRTFAHSHIHTENPALLLHI
jgi:hypothetical protein